MPEVFCSFEQNFLLVRDGLKAIPKIEIIGVGYVKSGYLRLVILVEEKDRYWPVNLEPNTILYKFNIRVFKGISG